jgi:hypothetical protein
MFTNKHIILQHNYFLISKISKPLNLVLSYLPRKFEYKLGASVRFFAIGRQLDPT